MEMTFWQAWVRSTVVTPAALLVLATQILHVRVNAAAPGVFLQDTGTNSLLVIEAEHFHTNMPRGIHTWILITNAAASGGKAMQALPNDGTNYDSGYAALSPRLDFRAYFAKAGTYHVWIRSFATNGLDDSMHFGLDGIQTASSERMGTAVYNVWNWSRNRTNGTTATINVPTPGVHTLNVWMREDGFLLDKLLLTDSGSYVPTGTGPPESPSNQPPVPRAGPDQTVAFPATAILSGSATDDGLPSNQIVVAWSKVAGPGTVTFTNTATLTTRASFSTNGVYVLRLTANDTALSASDDIQITLNAAAPGVFVQDTGTNGLLVIEAEHFHTNTPRATHAWALITNTQASGGKAMQALPNNGTNYDSGYAALSPRLDFRAYFAKAGTYHVWIRSFATNGLDDSMHFGLDGVQTASSERMGTAVHNVWNWSRDRTNGTAATINVPTPGVHTLNVWMREDGFLLDKLLLTDNGSYVPTGIGPPESPSDQPPPSVFVQDAGPDGILVIEVEHSATNTARAPHAWTAMTNAAASGNIAMQALPNVGTNYNTGYAASSPRMNFNVQFTKTGTHNVWIRCYAPGGMDDSMHFGLDGVETPSSAWMGTTLYNTWTWSRERTNGLTATINVTTPGLHVLNVWMREDGFLLDKLLLTVNGSYVPTGLGPPESPFASPSSQPETVSISLADLLDASQILDTGDIPEDTFAPPGNALYVALASSGGNDSNPGTLAAPFEHLDKAIAVANANPGTPYTINLRGGTHYFKSVDAMIEIRRGNLYIRGYGNEPVTIRPFYWPGNPSAWWEQRCFVAYGAFSNLSFENLTIEGFQIAFDIGGSGSTTLRQVTMKNIVARNFRHRDADPNQLRVFLQTQYLGDNVYGPGKQIFTNPDTAHYQIQNVILGNIEVYDTDIAVNIGDENDANIKGLRISNFRLINPAQQAGGTSANDGLAIVNCYKVLIDGCALKNIEDDGIDTKSFDVVVINTEVRSTGRNGVKFWRGGELINSIVYRCTPINDAAISLAEGPCRIVHSALISKTNGYSATFGYGHSPASVGPLEIVNSIFVDLDHSMYVVNQSLTSRNSLYFDIRDHLFTGGVLVRNIAELNARTGSFGNIAVNPMLTDPPAGNFAPRPGSPCIDAGTAAGVLLPSFDFLGRPRISGSTPDIGPVEFSEQGAGLAAQGEPPVLTARIEAGTRRHVIRWTGAAGITYDVYAATSLNGPWALVPHISGNIGNGETITATNTVGDEPTVFYRVKTR